MANDASTQVVIRSIVRDLKKVLPWASLDLTQRTKLESEWEKRIQGVIDLSGRRNQPFLRLMMEFEKYRRQVEDQAQKRVRSLLKDHLDDFLALGDHISEVKNNSPEESFDQIRLIEEGFFAVLGNQDIAPMVCVGTPYDPDRHEAIMHSKSDEPPGTVIEEVSRGYTWKGRLIRRPKVVVSS